MSADDSLGNTVYFSSEQLAAVNSLITPSYFEKSPGSIDQDAPVVSFSSIQIIHDSASGNNYLELRGNCSDDSPLNNIFVSYLSMVDGVGQGNSFRIKNEDLNQNGDFVFSHQISDTVPSGNFKINYLSADDSLGNTVYFSSEQLAAVNSLITPSYFEKSPGSIDQDAPVVSFSSIQIIHDSASGNNYLELRGNCSDDSPLNNIFVSYLSMVDGVGQGNSFRIKNEDLNQNGDFVFSHQISDTVPSGDFSINYLSADDSLGNTVYFSSEQLMTVNSLITPSFFEKSPGFELGSLPSSINEDASFSYQLMTQLTSEGSEINMQDPVGFVEHRGSSNNDDFRLSSDTVYFGGPGNDIIRSGYNGENQIAIGGDGDDIYKISSPGYLTISDLSASSFDVVEATGIGVYRENTYFATIDGGRHLYIFDIDSGQNVIALDYQDQENRIEQIRASDATFSYDDLIYFMSISPNNLGDTTWSNLASVGGTDLSPSLINDSIEYYKIADVFGETVSYEVVVKPDWMTISPSGLITGTPENEHVGDHTITVTATDSAGASETKSFIITVNNVNDVPVLAAISDRVIDEDLTSVIN